MTNLLFTAYCSLLTVQCPLFNLSTFTSFILQPSSFQSPPLPKIINRNHMTGTKQLLGHLYRLLDLLWQMPNRGRPTPTNSTGKKTLPGSITGYLATTPVSHFILHPSSFIRRSYPNVRSPRTYSSASNLRRILLTTYSCTLLRPWGVDGRCLAGIITPVKPVPFALRLV
jgi:hypothetical protein